MVIAYNALSEYTCKELKLRLEKHMSIPMRNQNRNSGRNLGRNINEIVGQRRQTLPHRTKVSMIRDNTEGPHS